MRGNSKKEQTEDQDGPASCDNAERRTEGDDTNTASPSSLTEPFWAWNPQNLPQTQSMEIAVIASTRVNGEGRLLVELRHDTGCSEELLLPTIGCGNDLGGFGVSDQARKLPENRIEYLLSVLDTVEKIIESDDDFFSLEEDYIPY